MYAWACIALVTAAIAGFACYWYVLQWAEILFLSVLGFRVMFRNKQKDIVLTIDDAPYRSETFAAILRVLDQHYTKATFFVISSQINEMNKPMLIQAVQRGHHLANHGQIDRKHANLSHSELSLEIRHCERAIADIYKAAKKPLPHLKYYRPGCGMVNSTIDQYARENGYTIVLGTNYPNDPYISSTLINKWYIMNHLKAHDIIILHDRAWTPALLEVLLPAIKARKHNVSALIQ